MNEVVNGSAIRMLPAHTRQRQPHDMASEKDPIGTQRNRSIVTCDLEQLPGFNRLALTPSDRLGSRTLIS